MNRKDATARARECLALGPAVLTFNGTPEREWIPFGRGERHAFEIDHVAGTARVGSWNPHGGDCWWRPYTHDAAVTLTRAPHVCFGRADAEGNPQRTPKRVTCGNCGRSWCERCDPAPDPLCVFCHGAGTSSAELPTEPR